MRFNAIAIAGLPGSGKTSLVRSLLSLKKFSSWQECSTGGLLRERHKRLLLENPELKISFEEYLHTITDEEIIELNKMARERVSKGNLILDSRFAAANCKGLDVLTIFLTAPLEVRVGRTKENDKKTARDKLIERENWELKQGQKHYSDLFDGYYDYRDPVHYNIVIDTSKHSIEEEVKIIESLIDPKVIAISGLAGTGSSTTARVLAEKLGFNYFIAGNLFKDIGLGRLEENKNGRDFIEICKEKNISIPKFEASNNSDAVIRLWNSDFGKDRRFHEAIDELQRRLAAKGNYVIEGKLAINSVKEASLKIWLKVSNNERIRRTSERDSIDSIEAEEIIAERDRIESEEWKRIYSISREEQEFLADLVINVEDKSTDTITNEILDYLKRSDFQ